MVDQTNNEIVFDYTFNTFSIDEILATYATAFSAIFFSACLVFLIMRAIGGRKT